MNAEREPNEFSPEEIKEDGLYQENASEFESILQEILDILSRQRQERKQRSGQTRGKPIRAVKEDGQTATPLSDRDRQIKSYYFDEHTKAKDIPLRPNEEERRDEDGEERVAEEFLDQLREDIAEGQEYKKKELALALFHNLRNMRYLTEEEFLSTDREIKELLRDLSKEDTESYVLYCRVFLLEGIFNLFYHSGSAIPTGAVNEAVDRLNSLKNRYPEESDYALMLSEAYRIQAYTFINRDMETAALTAAKNAERLARQSYQKGEERSFNFLVQICDLVAGLCIVVNDYESADQYYQKMLAMLEGMTPEEDEDGAYLDACCGLARVKDVQSNYTEALVWLDLGLQRAKSIQNPTFLYLQRHADLLLMKSNVLNEYEDHVGNLKVLEELFILTQENRTPLFAPDSIGQGQYLISLGKICHRKGVAFMLLGHSLEGVSELTRSLMYYRETMALNHQPDICRCVLQITANVGHLYGMAGRFGAGSHILRKLYEFAKEELAAGIKDLREDFPMFLSSYATILLKDNQVTEALRVTDEAIEILHEMVEEEGKIEFQSIYAKILNDRATDFAGLGVDAKQSIQDLAQARHLLEYSMEDNDFEAVDLYMIIVTNLAKQYAADDDVVEASSVLKSIRPFMDSLMKAGRHDLLEDIHDPLANLIRITSELGSHEKAAQLCKDLIDELTGYQQEYDPRKPIDMASKSQVYRTSLGRITPFELEDAPDFPWPDDPGQRIQLEDWQKRDPERFVAIQKRRWIIWRRFEVIINSFDIFRQQYLDDQAMREQLCAKLKQWITNMVGLIRKGRLDEAGPLCLYTNNFLQLKLKDENPLSVKKYIDTWIGQATRPDENEVEPEYIFEVAMLYKIRNQFMVMSIPEETQIVEEGFEEFFSYCLQGFRGGVLRAGFEFGEAVLAKAVWQEEMGYFEGALTTLNNVASIQNSLLESGFSGSILQRAKCLYQYARVEENQAAVNGDFKCHAHLRECYQKAIDMFMKDENWSSMPEILWYLAIINRQMGVLYRLDDLLEEAKERYSRTIMLFVRLKSFRNADEYNLEIAGLLMTMAKMRTKSDEHAQFSDSILFIEKACLFLNLCPPKVLQSQIDLCLNVWRTSFNMHMFCYDMDQAEKYVSKMVAYLQELPRDELRGKEYLLLDVLNDASFLFVRMGSLDKAQKLQEGSILELNRIKKMGGDPEPGELLIGVTEVFLLNELGENEKGWKLVEDKMDRLEKYMENPTSETEVFCDMMKVTFPFFMVNGTVCLIEGGFPERARDVLLDLYEKYENNDSIPGRVNLSLYILDHLSQAYRDCGQMKEAEETLTVLFERIKDMESPTEMVHAIDMVSYLHTRCDFYFRKKEYNAALCDCERAMKLLHPYWGKRPKFLRQSIAETLIRKGDILKAMGREKEGHGCLKEADFLIQELIQEGAAQFQRLYGRVRRSMGESE